MLAKLHVAIGITMGQWINDIVMVFNSPYVTIE